MLGTGWEVESASPEVWRRLAGLPDGDAGTGRLPPAVLSVAGTALRSAERPDRAGTAQIAAELVVSPHTVQQHLTSVFDKTGVRSRRDLVGRILFTHYEPRLRDNEDRAVRARPLRGGPLPGESRPGGSGPGPG